jgi:hypothetical protein
LLIEAAKEQQLLIERQQRHIQDQESQIARLTVEVKEIQGTLRAVQVTSAKKHRSNAIH